MWFAVDGKAGPAVLDDFHGGFVDVFVGRCEVGGKDRSEELWGIYRVLLGGNVGCLFHGVCGDDNTIIGNGIPRGGSMLVEL